MKPGYVLNDLLMTSEEKLKVDTGKHSNQRKNTSTHRRCSVKKSVLRNFAKFKEKQLYQRLFFNKFVGLSLATLLKRVSGTGSFCEFYEISNSIFLWRAKALLILRLKIMLSWKKKNTKLRDNTKLKKIILSFKKNNIKLRE